MRKPILAAAAAASLLAAFGATPAFADDMGETTATSTESVTVTVDKAHSITVTAGTVTGNVYRGDTDVALTNTTFVEYTSDFDGDMLNAKVDTTAGGITLGTTGTGVSAVDLTTSLQPITESLGDGTTATVSSSKTVGYTATAAANATLGDNAYTVTFTIGGGV